MKGTGKQHAKKNEEVAEYTKLLTERMKKAKEKCQETDCPSRESLLLSPAKNKSLRATGKWSHLEKKGTYLFFCNLKIKLPFSLFDYVLYNAPNHFCGVINCPTVLEVAWKADRMD